MQLSIHTKGTPRGWQGSAVGKIPTLRAQAHAFDPELIFKKPGVVTCTYHPGAGEV